MGVGAYVDEMVGNPANMRQVVVEECEVPLDALVCAPDISEIMNKRSLWIEQRAEDISEVGFVHLNFDSFAVWPRNFDLVWHLTNDKAVGNSPPANNGKSEATSWSDKNEQ